MERKSWLKLLLACLLASCLALAGCGDDGKDGAPGADGADAAVTGETCVLCHDAGKTEDVVQFHLAEYGPKAVVADIVVSSAAGANDSVTFNVFENDGTTGIAGLTISDVRFYIAAIVPDTTVTGNAPVTTWDTPYLERWLYEREGSSYPTGVLTDNTGGSYTYDFVADLEVGDLTRAPEFDVTELQRLLIRADTRDLGINRTMEMLDFIIPADGASTTEVGVTREIVVMEACTACHNDPLQEAAHGGGYQSPQACNICHTPIGVDYGDLMQTDEAWLASVVHKIHAAIDMAAFPTRINGGGYSNVTFPQPVTDCVICHFDDGQDMADAYLYNPTAEVCSTCHESFDATTHMGGQADNSGCAGCHEPGRFADAEAAHNLTLVPLAEDEMEFDVTITMTAPAVGTFYDDDETPIVTVTLTPADGGPAVDYLAAKDTIGDRDGVMFGANLYVYGPREHFEPVLTAAAAAGGQSNALFTGGTDPQVITDATGFKYQLDAIDLPNGTYIVRFEGGDFGWDSTQYQTSSNAIITFQVGTDTLEDKVAGDNCVSCHGDTRMHTQGAHPHNATFDTDECSSCHDYSGNYGTSLEIRVHAVHAAADLGADGHSREWTHITFPQDIYSCDACHTSGNTSFNETIYGAVCMSCHAESTLSTDHILQQGGDYNSPIE